MNSTLDQKTIEKIRKVKGVNKVQPEIDMMLDEKIGMSLGGLSVINTMIMSISERTREIGLGLGTLLINFINNNFATSGNKVFLVDSNVVIIALGFAVFLGTFAGIYPAIHAARLNPVKALRDE